GMAVAFMAKMSVAVVVGDLIGTLLPVWLVALLTAGSFVGVAIAMWRKPDIRTPKEKDTRILKSAAGAVSTLFFSHGGDKGMVSPGRMAAGWFGIWTNHGHVPANSPLAGYTIPSSVFDLSRVQVGVIVWLGAVAAMVTKGGLAVTLGASIRNWIATHV